MTEKTFVFYSLFTDSTYYIKPLHVGTYWNEHFSKHKTTVKLRSDFKYYIL